MTLDEQYEATRDALHATMRALRETRDSALNAYFTARDYGNADNAPALRELHAICADAYERAASVGRVALEHANDRVQAAARAATCERIRQRAARPEKVVLNDAIAWIFEHAINWVGRTHEYMTDAEDCGYLIVLPADARDGRLHVAALEV